MPARMIRDALLTSDRFLGLPDNTARMCFVVCMLTADDRGNLEASPGALVRLWRDFGVDSNAKAVSTSQFLADQDLIRLYQVGGKQYIHVPRFGQRMRSFKRACPASPWCEKSDESTETAPICQQVAANGGGSRPEVKGSEEKGSTPSGSRRSAKTPIPDDFAITDRMRSWAAEKRVFNLEAHFDFFVNQAKAKDYRNVNWERAFMNAVLADWPKIGRGQPSAARKVAL